MAPQFVDSEALRALLGMRDAVEALEQAFVGTLPVAPDRSHLDAGTGDLLVMPAWSDSGAGVKLVTVAPGNPGMGLPLIQGVYVLFDKPALRPVALFDAAALTALRTAAVSGVATRALARTDSKHLVIFGAGVQARAHLEAMTSVHGIENVEVVSRSEERAAALVDLATDLGVVAALGDASAVGRADIVCTCTTSSDPLFDGGCLRPGTHINAVGSYKPFARELDDRTMERGRVVVDTPAALRESGDILAPLESGVISAGDIMGLADVVSKGHGRTDQDEITIFKSVGAAFEDLVVAEAAAARL